MHGQTLHLRMAVCRQRSFGSICKGHEYEQPAVRTGTRILDETWYGLSASVWLCTLQRALRVLCTSNVSPNIT